MLNVKMPKFKLNRLSVFQLVLILLFIFFLIFLLSPKNYTKNYKIKDIAIKEVYNKKNKAYYFTLNYHDYSLDLLFLSNYKQNRGFIKDITIVENEEDFCLIPEGETFNFYPVCVQEKTVVAYPLVSKALKEKLPSNLFPASKIITTYNDIDIYNDTYSYYIWNYDGFYYINNKENKKIDIFDKELYTINLIGYTKNYLVIPDYDSNYTFNQIYTVELKNGKLKKYELDRDIYFDSYYPGFIKNKLYIVDNKEPAMYEFNAKNGKLDKMSAKLYLNGKWEKENIKTLVASKPSFTSYSNYVYELEDNNLYLNYHSKNKILVATNVKAIIKYNNADIFYLKDAELYHFNPEHGEELLLNYFEWNFNYNNNIYIELPN